MGIRIMLAACLATGCTLLGRTMSSAVRRRSKCLETLISAVKQLRLQIAGMCKSVPDSLEIAGCDSFRRLGEEMKQGFSASEAWKNARQSLYRRGGEFDSLLDGDMEILDNLFDRLGESGRREQENLLTDAIKYLSRQSEGAKLQLAERDRLYVTVGFLFGLILAIMVV